MSQTTNVSRREFLRCSAGATLALGAPSVLAGCGGGSGGDSGPATVRLWTWYTQQREQFPQLIEEFEASHPNIKVQNRLFGDTNSYLPALQSAVASGDPPEIFGPHVLAIQYGEGGISADLRKELGGDFLGDFFESANAEYSVGESQYALGWMAQTFGLDLRPRGPAQGEGRPARDLGRPDRGRPGHQARGRDPLPVRQQPGGRTGTTCSCRLVTQATDDPEGGARPRPRSQRRDLGLRAGRPGPRLWSSGLAQPRECSATASTGIETNQAEAAFYTGKGATLFMGSWAPQDFKQDAPLGLRQALQGDGDAGLEGPEPSTGAATRPAPASRSPTTPRTATPRWSS